MTRKIFRSIMAVAGIVLVASLVIILAVLYDYFGTVQKTQLADELSLAAVSVEKNGTEYLQSVESVHYRITWIAADGSVIYDTKTGADTLENHADRKEVQEALEYGKGENTRYSDTLLEKTIYSAVRLEDGTVLRMSVSQTTVGVLALGMLQPFFFILLAALILSGVLAARLSKRIVGPLNNLDLEHPLENDTYEELSPLLGRIERQHQEIAFQLRKLKQKTDEFTQITENMSEGLVLLDENDTVLSINTAAQQMFGAKNATGESFLEIDRSHEVTSAIKTAMENGHSEIDYAYNGRKYRINISRIESDRHIIGAVLLLFDVTEKALAEQNRREFTANVSHELKTPLQGIIGSADLIETGMVKQEDLPRFVGHIRQEATRLVALIEDILRLSQLDEGEEMPVEEVDLYAIADEVVQSLQSAAAAKKVTLALQGDSVTLHGVSRLIHEIVYNLCDNAIKYNMDSGSVTVTVKPGQDTAVVSVQDTGIGIAPEDQTRIFERFFRVDKSHSKASGGTGLGLSIVKHAVQFHHGTIDLQSALGHGTTITVSLPR